MQSASDKCFVSLPHSVRTYFTIPFESFSLKIKFTSAFNILLLPQIKKGAMHPCFKFFVFCPNLESPLLHRCKATWLKSSLVDMCNGNYTNIYNSITVLTVALLEKL